MPPAPAEAFWRRDKKNRAPGAIKNPPFGGFFYRFTEPLFLGLLYRGFGCSRSRRFLVDRFAEFAAVEGIQHDLLQFGNQRVAREQIGYQPKLLQAVEQVNYQQKDKLNSFIKDYFGSDLKGKTFALWGLAFKPNTDDMREASSRVLMEQLWAAGATVQAYDPEAMNEVQRIYGQRDDLKLMGTKEAALHGADALVICTEWQNFRAPDFDVIKSALKQPVIFDGRNLYDPERLENRGFTYYAIGRGASIKPVI